MMSRDDGTGLIGSFAGVTVVLVMLVATVQIAFNLHATSAVNAATYDAAVRLARSGFDACSPDRSEGAFDHARAVLGRYGERVTFTCAVDDGSVVVRARATNPRFLWAGVDGALGLDGIDRTVRVRIEEVR